MLTALISAVTPAQRLETEIEVCVGRMQIRPFFFPRMERRSPTRQVMVWHCESPPTYPAPPPLKTCNLQLLPIPGSFRPRLQTPTSTSPKPPPAEGLIYQLPSILERIDLGKVFHTPQPLEVELGCGDASFLLNYAKANPLRNFIGVERLFGRVNKIDRKGRRLGLTNLSGIRIESGYFLEYLLPAHCAEALHIYFPDPWPKMKHRRHRFINERFTALAHQALKSHGTVYLRTDDLDYFEQMLRVLAEDKRFKKIEAPPALLELKTDFEAEFNAQGIPTQHATYERID